MAIANQYYMCGNARRKGREVCPSPILRKDKVEGFVINRIKDCILTEENLEELVRLTNEELAQTCAEGSEKLELLQAQIAEVDSRLGKLYDALETGEFKNGELAREYRPSSGRRRSCRKQRLTRRRHCDSKLWTWPIPR